MAFRLNNKCPFEVHGFIINVHTALEIFELIRKTTVGWKDSQHIYNLQINLMLVPGFSNILYTLYINDTNIKVEKAKYLKVILSGLFISYLRKKYRD